MIEFWRRGRNERGSALLGALLIAILYFLLMGLALAESSSVERDIHRQRARIAAEILADNGAELAAAGMIERSGHSAEIETTAGKAEGTYTRLPGDRFVIEASGQSAGVAIVRARVILRGRFRGQAVEILESETW
ncbi:MAG TPA: hypothetical protein VM557_12650 [Thermoanaerobaculia bacterium]|nr:hypothetical protein [Thermoanaerobaculia bacterium]